MKKILLSFICFVLLLFTAKAQHNKFSEEITSGYDGDTINGLKILKKSINFCVLGDWGRHGMYGQKKVAQQLGNTATGIDADFIISTGDNFYPKGVKSVTDPSWQSSFEQVYTHHGTYTDWWVVLGNHDYKSNPDAQIAYSAISERWKMPARYFSITKFIDDDSTKAVDFFFLDTNPFQSDYYKDELYGPKVKAQDTTAQKKWLENGLRNSKAVWKIVVGHHPLYSAGKRKGKTADMMNSFRTLFNQYKVDVYFAGHEHHLEHDKAKGDSFQHIISGAGSEKRVVTNAPYTKFVVSAQGFFSVSMNSKAILLQAVNHKGEIIYTTNINKTDK
jgi:hypothetical protein